MEESHNQLPTYCALQQADLVRMNRMYAHYHCHLSTNYASAVVAMVVSDGLEPEPEDMP